MSQFSAEQRLELLKNIRQQSSNNDNIINNRKQILQGSFTDDGETVKFSTLKVRILLAVLLLIGFAFLSFTNKESLHNVSKTIVTEIEKDYNVTNSVQDVWKQVSSSFSNTVNEK